MWAKFAEVMAKILASVFAGYMTWKAGRDSLRKDLAESQVKVSKESDRDKDEIVKLSKAALRVRGSKWVRPNN